MKRYRIRKYSAGAVLAAVLLLVALTCSCSRPANNVPVADSGIYAAQPRPDYTQFTAFTAVSGILGVDNVLAFYKNTNRVYYRAGLTTTDEPYLTEADDKLMLNVTKAAELLGKSDASGVVEVTKTTKVADLVVSVYDNRMVIITEADKVPDQFSDMYTYEYLSLLLKGAGEEDLTNAFIKLPSKVTNGSNTVYYTAPDLNLGLQTDLYYSQIGDTTVVAGPSIVAGQGELDSNYTLVRVFNRQQAISAQFLAYPTDVRGGVQVAAATFSMGDSKETLIATAPYSAKGTGADTVRVFDTTGVIRAAFRPEGLSAPYVIATGRFVAGSSDDYLAVASGTLSSGTFKLNIYSLADMTLKTALELEYSAPNAGTSADANKGALKVSFSRRAGDSTDSIIMYFQAANKAYICDPAANSVSELSVTLPDNATGVYASAFDNGFTVTLKDPEDNYSRISRINSLTGTPSLTEEIDVGWRENRFYSSFAPDNPDGYVDKGTFHHVRVDLASPMINTLTNSETVYKRLTDSERNTYSRWAISFTDKATFHNGYHMWEPCFTHRWNRTNSTTALAGVVDADGNARYASIGRDNIAGNYLELGSSFLIGTYADGLLELGKMRIYPLRSYLQGLAVQFRGADAEPEKLIAVSPVHEQEINVAGSVGDYNVNMIRGFREYMLGLYGSIENINRRFGTNFANESEFDAPRYDPKQDDPSACRGEWDTYGGSDFFTHWSLYTRLIVNKRIMEAYREALLAGFPPEAINAHQIPEGDAVSGFLGEADTRLSPVEAVTVCGTAYGGTRYGVWYTDENNFLNLAFKAGHNNITLGEYGSITTNYDRCLNQLRYMFSHGVRFLHMIVPLDTNSLDYKYSVNVEKSSIEKLQEENNPRNVSTGITQGSIGYVSGDFRFDIVQMSRHSETGGIGTGLLKSVNQDGSWEGTVYLAPFHANVLIADVAVKGSADNGFTTDKISGLQCGDQVELTFAAAYSGEAGGRITIAAYNGGYLLNDSVTVYELGSALTPYRFVFSNQLTPEDITLEIKFENIVADKLNLFNLNCTAQYEDIAHKYFGDTESSAADGGVSFDIVTR